MDIDTDYDNDDFAYDSSVEDLTDEEAIAELVAEGYTEEEARRMLGDYDPSKYADCDYYDEDDGIPDDDFVADMVDDEDFD
jgi:hypothetical protein